MKKRKNILNSLEYKYGRYAINNLMLVIVGAMAIVFAMDFIISSAKGLSIYNILVFDRASILNGQIWRVITFVFLPVSSSIIFMIFALYFYYMIGSALEHEWGALKFNIFYIFGILCTIAAGFITGYASNTYLNMSLFLAFAILYPNYEILLFFFFPVKMKYLALINAAVLIYIFAAGHWTEKVSMIISLLNLLLFFRRELISETVRLYRNIKFKINRR